MLAQVQKEAVRIAISLNPTTVYVKRKEYVPDGGGRKLVESEPGEHVILLFSRLNVAEVAETGGKADKVTWMALADADANLKWGANVTDEFEVAEIGEFRIVDGQPIQAEGQLAGWQLVLEKVK